MRNDMGNDMGKALCMILEKNFNEYCKEIDEAVKADPHVFSETFCKKMDKLIRRSKRPWYSMVSTPMKKVAVAILAFLVVTFTSVMSIRAAREAVIGFFVQVYETFSVVFFGEDNANEEDVPEGRAIAEPMPDYEITALPEGYELVYSFEDEWSVRKRYKDSKGYSINFLYMMNNSNYVVMDTEYVNSKICNIGEIVYEYVIEDDFTQFIWEDSGFVFSLKAKNFDTAKALVSSISLKK